VILGREFIAKYFVADVFNSPLFSKGSKRRCAQDLQVIHKAVLNRTHVAQVLTVEAVQYASAADGRLKCIYSLAQMFGLSRTKTLQHAVDFGKDLTSKQTSRQASVRLLWANPIKKAKPHHSEEKGAPIGNVRRT
jgi:hypothetical protein